jgi:hypothetical protein
MDSLCRRPRAGSLLLLPLCCLLSACISLGPLFPQSSEDPPPEKTTTSSNSQATPGARPTNGNGARGGYLHSVRWQGETLSLIAQWYTGSWKNWRALADANRAIDPNRLAIGDRVLIPEGLLKNRKPLPRDLVLSLAAKERAQQPASTLNPERDEPLDLFGPKE